MRMGNAESAPQETEETKGDDVTFQITQVSDFDDSEERVASSHHTFDNDEYVPKEWNEDQQQSGFDVDCYLDRLHGRLDMIEDRKNVSSIIMPRESLEIPKAPYIVDSDSRNRSATDFIIARQHLRSWAAKFSAHGSRNNESSTEQWKELLQSFTRAVDNLAAENESLTNQLEMLHVVESNLRDNLRQGPTSLRAILLARIAESKLNEGSKNMSPQSRNIFKDRDGVPPIPPYALDARLNINQAAQIQRYLSTLEKDPALYQGLSIHTCSQCERPRLQLLGFSPHPFVSQLNEFPRSECYTFQDRCSSCGRQELRQSLSVDWWQQLNNMFWLKFNWDEGCCFEWIVSVHSLKAVMESLQCDDLHIVRSFTER